jgi:DNA-binding CsgD family transcriptional regulator
MEIAFYFINFMAFIFSVLAALLLILLFLRLNKNIFLYVLLLFSPFALGTFISLMSFADLAGLSLGTLSPLFHIINASIASFTIPYAALKLFDYKIKILHVFLLILMATANISFSFIDHLFAMTLILRALGLMFIYYLFLKNRKNIIMKELKAFYKAFLIANTVLVTGIIFMAFLTIFNSPLREIFRGLPMDQLYTGALGLLIFVFLSRFFFTRKILFDYQEEEDILKKYNLTPRECEVVQLILNGYTSKDAAEILKISQQTVKNHTGNIYQKTKVSSKIELFQLLNLQIL